MNEDRARIIIYGKGDFGTKLFHFLKKNGFVVDYFCQTENDGQIQYMNVPVCTPKDLAMLKGEIVLLIAIADKTSSSNVKSMLTSMFLDKARIYECGSFIKDNLLSTNTIYKQYCLCCNTYIDGFESGGIEGGIFEKHHIIGGGYRKAMRCPNCKRIDRERWELYVLSNYTEIFNEKCRVLHIAAEKNIKQRIYSNKQCDYYTGDIVPGKQGHVVDVTNIQFKDDTFDYIIMNHVLEHIQNEEKAISELKRVLKNKGKLIMSFPICTDMKTIEGLDIETEEERLRYYGQEDHVRLYGIDYKERLEKYGLKISVYSPQNECSQEEIDRYGLICDDIMMICEKNN